MYFRCWPNFFKKRYKMDFQNFLDKKETIGIVGLGYVGLPLAVLFNKKFNVVGFDINEKRISELKDLHDRTLEITPDTLKKSTILFSTNPLELKRCSLIIVTVPTPIDEHKTPDLTPMIKASWTVGKNMSAGTVVVYESTVYPGVTEEICVPELEKASGYIWKKDFNVGYSPERVNPGDKNHTIDKIIKVVSGDTDASLLFLKNIYGTVITAGIHAAPSIKTAEAAKVIENTQRDLNIALMNELSVIFNRMNLDTQAVLEAAGTKWNFLKFFPGLVGGHCIGVDPYYLTFKAQSLGYHPEVILAGRRINDRMGNYVAEQTVKKMVRSGKIIEGQKVLICGFTFKENIPDIRNTRVIDIYKELEDYGVRPCIYDPHIDQEELKNEYGITSVKNPEKEGPYGAIIFAVKHHQFKSEFSLAKCIELQNGSPVIMDLKGLFEGEQIIEIKNKKINYFRL